MEDENRPSPSPSPSLKMFFQPPKSPFKDDEDEKDPLKAVENFKPALPIARSSFTDFFCKPKTVRMGKSTEILDSNDLKRPRATINSAIEITSSPENTPSPKRPSLEAVIIDSDESEVYDGCVVVIDNSEDEDNVKEQDVVQRKNVCKIEENVQTIEEEIVSSIEKNQVKPVRPVKKSPSRQLPSLALDLSTLDPGLREAFLKKKAATASATDTTVFADGSSERTVLFKIVPRLDATPLKKKDPLFIRSRIDDNFGRLKAMVAKEICFSAEFLVLVYEELVLFDNSKPTTMNLIGTDKKTRDKSKAIEISVFTKSSWEVEYAAILAKRKTFLESAQYLDKSVLKDASSESEEEAKLFGSQSFAPFTISIRTSSSGHQSINVQVPQTALISDVIEKYISVSGQNLDKSRVKVKFDGELLGHNTIIDTVLEDQDMLDFVF